MVCITYASTSEMVILREMLILKPWYWEVVRHMILFLPCMSAMKRSRTPGELNEELSDKALSATWFECYTASEVSTGCLCHRLSLSTNLCVMVGLNNSSDLKSLCMSFWAWAVQHTRDLKSITVRSWLNVVGPYHRPLVATSLDIDLTISK